jgi:hypothetical protein
MTTIFTPQAFRLVSLALWCELQYAARREARWSHMPEETKAIIDNTSFAGVMRLYAPDLEAHRKFLKDFPSHKQVDELSLADFLTAICAFDTILLENSSRASYFNSADVQPIKESETKTWVDQLRELLPSKVAKTINAAPFLDKHEVVLEGFRAQEVAFDIFHSPLRETVKLQGGEKIPEVYMSPTYKFRGDFTRLNMASGNPLDDRMLAQAMFLHRGLYLQAYALNQSAIYMPYLYRGRMLASLPPLITLAEKEAIPLLKDNRPPRTEYLTELNKFYYELLNKLTWAAYDESVPFIGAAILASARGSVRTALDMAMELREAGEIRDNFRWLQDAIKARDRAYYEGMLSEIKASLTKANHALGGSGLNPKLLTFYRLATFWMPSGAKEALAAIWQLAPQSLKEKVNKFASKLLEQDSFQLMFLNHVKAIRL